jgi:hypothetical protein
MKRALLLCLLCLVPALALCSVAPAWAFISTGDGGWVWQNPLPQGNDLYSVAFSDASHGWAVGDGGTILATTNGGATWTKQSSGTTNELNGVAFSDASHGWVVGSFETYYPSPHDYGTILATSTGGLVTAKLTLKLNGLTSGVLNLGKSLTAKGTVTPTSLAGGKVALTVQRLQSGTWRAVTSVAQAIGASGTYGWTYKPSKKGTYRIKATIAKTAAHTAATTTWLTLKVK